MNLRNLVAVVLTCLASFAFADQDSGLSLKLGGVELTSTEGFSATLIKDQGLGVGMEVTLIAENTSETQVIDLDLYGATCYYTDVDGYLVQDCAPLQLITLEDAFGNDLKGGVMPSMPEELYPSDRRFVTVYGRRPVGNTFTLRLGEVALEGRVPDQ